MRVRDVSASGARQVVMERAILLYRSEGGGTLVATVHPVEAKAEGGRRKAEVPVIGAGRCLTREALEEVVRSMAGTAVKRTVLPEQMLMCEAGRMCWWRPSTRRPIFFNTTDKDFNRDMVGAVVPYPALVFMAKPGVLYVWALAEDRRPTGETELYRAPFMNLYEGGNMCAGDTRLPEVVLAGEIGRWEASFYDTRFTHTNIQQRVTSFEGGHAALWRSLRGASEFPADALVKLGSTLEQGING